MTVKRIFAVSLCICLILSLFAGLGTPAGAAGKVNEIWSIEDLYDIRYAPDQDYVLMADIDMEKEKNSGFMGSDKKWPTIESFSGSLDGNGHTISGLNANLFTTNSGTISNLNLYGLQAGVIGANQGVLDGLVVFEAQCICVFAGVNNEEGTIRNCRVNDMVPDLKYHLNAYKYNNRAGGLVGTNYGTIENCAALNADWTWVYSSTYTGVDERQYTGCICCYNYGIIRNSFCWGENNVYQMMCYFSNGIVENCYANMKLFWRISFLDDATVNCCYTTSNKLFDEAVEKNLCSNCYAKTGSLSLPLMQRESTFVGFDFENTWIIDNTVDFPYPQLRSNRQDTEKLVNEIVFQSEPSAVVYRVGDSITADGTITATYIDNTTENIPITEAMLSGFDMNEIGEQTVTVTYRNKTLTYGITVRPLHTVTGVSLVSGPDQTEFIQGAELDYTGAFANITYADGDTEQVALTPDNTTGGSTEETGSYNVTYSNSGFSVTFRITVKASHTVTGVSLVSEPNQAEFTQGAKLDYTGAVAKITYADGDTENVNLTPDNTTGGSTEKTGTYNVTYTNGGYSVTFKITVTEKAPIVIDPATIQIAEASAVPGQKVSIPVSIQKNPGIAGATFTVSYDRTALTLDGAEKGAVLSKGTFTPNAENGVITWYHTSDVSENGILFTLNFTVKAGAKAGNYPVALALKDGEPANFSNQEADIVPIQFTNGAVTVEKGVLGDVTGDGKVLMNDVVKLARAAAGFVTLNSQEQALGDVTGDGKVLINDVVKEARFVGGFITSLEPTAKLAATGDTADIKTSSVTGCAGDTVNVPVSIPVNPGIAGAIFSVSYDEDALVLKQIEKGDVFSGGTFISDTEKNIVQWYDVEKNQNTTITGTLFTLTFQVKDSATAGSYPVTVALKDNEPANISDIDSEAVAVTFTPGAVQVEEPAPLQGFLTAEKIPNGLSVKVTPQTGLIFASGYVAVYDGNGQMLSVVALKANNGEQTVNLNCDASRAQIVKAFFLDGESKPVVDVLFTSLT